MVNFVLKTTVLVAILSVLFEFIFRLILLWTQNAPPDPQAFDLVIGIISARQNIQQRQTIRETWAKYCPDNVKIYFILAHKDCPVSPENRVDDFSCRELIFNVSEDLHYTPLSSTASNAKRTDKSILYNGFSFSVHHPIRIQKLGILKSALLDNSFLTVKLIQGTSKEVIVKKTIGINEAKSNDSEVNGYIYSDIDEYVYPRGFEGIVHVYIEDLPKETTETFWNNNSSAVTYKVFYSGDIIGNNYQRHPLIGGDSASSFQFIYHDLPSIKKMVNESQSREHKWENFTANLAKLLEEEENKWNDIIFVNTTEVYRFLPKKLLFFYKWLSDNQNFSFKFVLKTDDDTIILINDILHELKSLPKENLWWGKFRKNWAVNHFGKWAEDAYTSPVYPAFACGAGSVLSSDLVKWISLNSETLHQYQGEDVSLGIWLSAVNPNIIEDKRWACDDTCFEGSYNRVQLSMQQIQESWKTYLECSKICTCSEA